MARRFFGFGVYDHDLDEYSLIAPLIGQLGKNYTNGYNKLITGDELIGLAFLSVRTAQYIVVRGNLFILNARTSKFLSNFIGAMVSGNLVPEKLKKMNLD